MMTLIRWNCGQPKTTRLGNHLGLWPLQISSGPVRNLSAAKLGLPQVGPAESNGSGVGRRRMFDGFLDHRFRHTKRMKRLLGKANSRH